MFMATFETRREDYQTFGKSRQQCKTLMKRVIDQEYLKGYFESYIDSFHCVEVFEGQAWRDLDCIVSLKGRAIK